METHVAVRAGFADMRGHFEACKALVCSFMLLGLLNLGTIVKVAEPSSVPAPLALALPASPSKLFTGQHSILEKMKQCFEKAQFRPDTLSQLVFVLHGLGGAGKTEVVLKFLELDQKDYHL